MLPGYAGFDKNGLRRTITLHQTTFAMGEALAHLHLLWFDGRLQRRLSVDGIYRFTTG